MAGFALQLITLLLPLLLAVGVPMGVCESGPEEAPGSSEVAEVERYVESREDEPREVGAPQVQRRALDPPPRLKAPLRRRPLPIECWQLPLRL